MQSAANVATERIKNLERNFEILEGNQLNLGRAMQARNVQPADKLTVPSMIKSKVSSNKNVLLDLCSKNTNNPQLNTKLYNGKVEISGLSNPYLAWMTMTPWTLVYWKFWTMDPRHLKTELWQDGAGAT